MPKGNDYQELISRLTRARAILDGVIADLCGDISIAKPKVPQKSEPSTEAPDFDMPIRAFVKRYAHDLTGPKKFTLLVAYLAKGDTAARVSRAEIEGAWGKLTSLLGAFNSAHTSRARENDWVATEKTGSYYLRPSWKDGIQ